MAAVDIGATKTLVTVRRLPLADHWSRSPRSSAMFGTLRHPDAHVERTAVAIERLLAPDERLVAIGCAAPGPLDPATGVIVHSPNLGWRLLPLADRLRSRLGVSVTVDDDGRLGALGEAVLGGGRGAHIVVYLTVSSGIGSGIVIDGEVVRGDHGLAGEVGHLTVDQGGPTCACGRRGDVEAYAGGRSLAHRAVRAWPNEALSDGTRAPRDAAGVFAAAVAGDRIAAILIDEATEALACAIAAIASAIDPGVILIGGALGLGQRRFVRSAAVRARRRVLTATGRVLDVKLASLGDQSVLAGAAIAAARDAKRSGAHPHG
ncbi:MAG: ROK family protein [Chloroflexi bacterium]|nr:ROK family protein [Chloroflexota bacterium]